MTTFKAHHDSMAEYVALACNPANPTRGWNTWKTFSDTGWTGMDVATLDEVAAVTRTGWHAGAERLHALVTSMDIPRLPSIRRRAVWSDRGSEVHMERVYSGRLDTAWRRIEKGAAHGVPRVRIVVDAIAPSRVDAEDMFWKGAAAAMLADALTQAGYSVEVISAFRGSPLGAPYTMTEVSVTVKPFNGPTTFPDMAASCAAPAFFRILGHAYNAGNTPGASPGWEGGMGAYSITEWPADGVQRVFIAGQNIASKDACLAWVRSCVHQLANPHETAHAA